MANNPNGVDGFLHPEGIYDDPQGGLFRAAIYPRLRAHFQFQNEKKLFSEVANRATFSINIYGCNNTVNFKNIANLFIPKTIDACFEHDGFGEVIGIKSARQDFSRKLKWGPSDFSDEKFSWRLLPSAARVRPAPAAVHNSPFGTLCATGLRK